MRKDFVANASHELRSPLTVISGYLDALADDQKLDPTWNPPVMEMRRQAERMGTIISDLLELSKLESGERRSEEQPIDIGGHAGAAAARGRRARSIDRDDVASADRQRMPGCAASRARCIRSSRTCCRTP